MGPRLRGPDQRRTQADRQDAVRSHRARDAPAPGEGSGGAQGANERGQSAGRLDEKNREPVRIQLDEHDQESAGAEVSGSRRARIHAGEAGSKEGVEEEIARSVIVARLTVLRSRGAARFRTALLRPRPKR